MENLADWDLPPEKGTEEATLDPYSNTAVSAPLSEEAAKKRAGKITAAFSGTEGAPSYEEILADVQSQREDRLKDRMATSEALKKQKVKQDVIRETIDKGDTSPDTIAFLQSLSLEDIADREGILEKKYAEWRVQSGLLSDESGTVDSVLEKDPDAANARVDSSVDRLYRKELFDRYYNEVNALYQQTGFGRTVIDFVADVLPLYTALEDRNITPDNVRAEGFWPGDYRRSQIRDMHTMPPKELESTLAQIKQRAIDTGDYAPFLKLLSDLKQYSAYAGTVDNAWALASLVELAPGGIVFDAVKGVGSVGRAGVKSYTTAEALRRAKEAVSGAASTPPTGQGTKAAGEAPRAPSGGTAQKMAEEANAAAGKGTTTVTVDGQTATVGKKMTEEEAANAGLFNSPAVRVNGKVYENNVGRASDSTHLDAFDTAVVEQGQEAVDNGEVIVGWTDAKGNFVPDTDIEYPKGDREQAGKSLDQALDRELTQKEVVLSAVAEKAAGSPKSIDELAQEINNSFTIDGQWSPRSGLIQEYNAALVSRELLDRRTGEVITSWSGDKYIIKELSDSDMKVERGDRSPLGFIRYAKSEDGPHEIFVNNDKIKRAFETKWWTKNGNSGFRSLPADTFKTLDEFRAFVVEHEITHIFAEDFPGAKDRNVFGTIMLEERVNFNALMKLGKTEAAKKAYPEYFAKKTAPGPDPAVIPAPPKAAELEKKAPEWRDPVRDMTGDNVISLQEARSAVNAAKTEQRVKEILFKMSPEDRSVLQNDILRANWDSIPKIPVWLKNDFDEWLRDSYSAYDRETAMAPENMGETIANFVEYQTEYIRSLFDVPVNQNTPQVTVDKWGDSPPWKTKAFHSSAIKINGKVYIGYPDHENAVRKALEDGVPEEAIENADIDIFGLVVEDDASTFWTRADEIAWEKARAPQVTVDIPSPATGGASQVQIPATDEALWQIYLSNVEDSGMRDMADDVTETFVAHGDVDRAAVAEAFDRVAKKSLQDAVKDVRTLAAKLPSILDPLETVVVGRPAHTGLKKIVNGLAEGVYKPVIERQAAIRSKLWQAWEASQKMGALRWSDDVFEAVKDIAAAQTRKTIGSPNSAILNVKHLREWESSARTNSVVFQLGTPDGRLFASPKQADYYAKEHYGLTDGAFTIHSLAPDKFWVQVARVVDETDPNILNKSIQLSTQTPVSWTGAFLPYLKGAAGVSSDTLQQNLRVSTHHAKALHEAFVSAAKDIGTLSKKEMRNLDALLAAKRDVEKIVVDPKTGKEEVVRGEWFENAQDLEKTYKRAFGEFPSENVVSAYFTLRQMYDFDFLHRNLKLYTEKTRKGFANAKLFLPWTDNEGNIRWTQQKEGVEVKVLDSVPSGNVDVLVLDSDTFLTHHFNTGKSGVEGIKALQEKGYKILQLVAPDQRPLKGTTTNYVNLVIARDVEISPLSFDQLPSTEGGHIRYYDGFYVKQPRYEITENGEKLYLGDRTVLSASSEAEGMKRAAAMEKARQLLKAGDMQGLKAHLESSLPWTIGQFEDLFKPRMNHTGKVVKEPQLDLDTPIVWVRDGQGTNDAAKTHAPELAPSFVGIRDTIDDPLNEMAGIGKKYTGEKDLTLHRVVEKDGVFEFENARMLSPLETMEQAWGEISRSIAADNLKIQASTNWVEEAASALLTPIEELRRNPWEALNNPQWNKQYGDIAKIRTLDAQRRQILNFLGQKDQLGSTLDWVRGKLMNAVFEKKGQAAADWVDDHLLPNVKNPLSFMRSFAFHTKMGFFNPIQLFLQSNTMINTWAITGNPARVGSALSGVMLMQMSRVNRTPEVLAALGKKAEKLGWKPGEWQEMDDMFHRLSLHIVEGEVGTLDVMTNPKMFKGAFGNFLDKGLVFFREGEKAVRMNAFAVAYKEFRDKFPTKVINNADENRILSRTEVLSGMMNRGDMALWQKGLSGPMTQFWGYQARVMEQLLGKQLTRAEKLRLGTAFAAMYGMPVSLAAATMFQIPGWSTDDLRQYALENGIDINKGIGSVAMNGIPAELIRWMTSDENGQGGLLLSIGDRYGPGGLPTIKNLLEAKDGALDALIDLAFGASGSITRDFFKNVLPQDGDIVTAAVNAPAMTLADYAGMFSTISTVNNSTKLYWALTTHRNLTKNGMDLGDKSAASAWVSFVTGLEEQKVKDLFLKLDSLKDLKAANEELGKEYLQQISKAKLLPPGEERTRRIAKATSLLSTMDPKDRKRYVKLGYTGSGSFSETTNENFNKKVLGN